MYKKKILLYSIYLGIKTKDNGNTCYHLVIVKYFKSREISGERERGDELTNTRIVM